VSKNMNTDLLNLDPLSILEFLPAGVVIIEAESRNIFFANNTALSMSGFSEEELLGRPCHELLCPANTHHCPILDHGLTLDHSERRMLRKDGSSFPVLKTVIPVLFGGRKVLFELVLDFSEQQNLMHRFFETIPDVLFSKDMEGVYTLANSAFENAIQTKEAHILGKTDYDLFDPDMAEYFLAQDRSAHIAGGPVTEEDFIQYSKNGAPLWLETTKMPLLNTQGRPIGTLGIGHDITKRKEAELQLERNAKIQITLRKIAEVTLTSLSVDAFYRKMSDIINELFPNSSFFISLIDEERDRVYIPVMQDTSGILPQERPRGRGFREYVLSQNRAVLLHPQEMRLLSQQGVLDPSLLNPALPENSQWIGCPLKDGSGKNVGVAVLFALDDEYHFTEGDKDIFSVAAANISLTLERIRAEADLKQSYEKLLLAQEGTVRILSNTAEVKDAYTAGHQRKVAELALAIARQMGLEDEDFQKTLEMAALIHDIGKIAIPTEILSKPGVLLPLEYELIKTHSQVGYELLCDEAMSGSIADTIFQHHERMNGSGYPKGLKGEEIRLEARIIAVADVVEAMSSFRPYRPSRGMAEAIQEIEKNAGILYDLQVVEACSAVLRSGEFRFSE